MRVTAVFLLLVSLVSGCATIARGYYVLHDGDLPISDTSFIASGLYRDGYIRGAKAGEPLFENVGEWPVVKLDRVDDGFHSVAVEVLPGNHSLVVDCYLPYKKTFASRSFQIFTQPGMRYEMASLDVQCNSFEVLVFERQADDSPREPVKRQHSKRFVVSGRTQWIATDEFAAEMSDRIVANHEAAEAADRRVKGALAAVANGDAIRSAGVGSRICPFDMVQNKMLHSIYGFVERVENKQIKILLADKRLIWDDPRKWVLCR